MTIRVLPLSMVAAILIHRYAPGHGQAKRGIAASFPGKLLGSSKMSCASFNQFSGIKCIALTATPRRLEAKRMVILTISHASNY